MKILVSIINLKINHLAMGWQFVSNSCKTRVPHCGVIVYTLISKTCTTRSGHIHISAGVQVIDCWYMVSFQYYVIIINSPININYIYIYIYIYCHPQTDYFVVSQLFSVARHVGWLKLGSKPTQLYIRLSIISLSQQANHVSSRIIRHCVVVSVCLHFCLTGYQSGEFIRRALHYASGSC